MSRIGKLPVEVPAKVQVGIEAGVVRVEGPLGKLSERVPPGVSVRKEGTQVLIERADESRQARASHGLARTLVANMVTGVTTGFKRRLNITGVGYKVETRGQRWLLFTLGYSHPILFHLPESVSATVNTKEGWVELVGYNKQVIGACAAGIRSLRPPEPYKGKGIRYADEVIRRKEGKTGSK